MLSIGAPTSPSVAGRWGAVVRAADEVVFDGVDDVAHASSAPGRVVVETLDRVGHVAQQPPTWAAAAGALLLAGPAGRRAAARGSVCWAAAAVLSNLVIKPFAGRNRPPKARRKLIGPVTSSFPSGHSATAVAFVFGARQELPQTFLPLGVLALVAHWSLTRSRGHYPSDVITGSVLGMLVAWAVGRVWPAERAEVGDVAGGANGDHAH